MVEKANLGIIKQNLDRLKEILKEETVYLAEFKPSKLSNLYEEKLEVLQTLENQKNLLKTQQEPANPTADEAIDFRSLCTEMDNVIEKHGRELIKAREANKFLMDAISQALQEHFKEVGAYDAKGADGQYLAKGESAVPPMKLNQTF